MAAPVTIDLADFKVGDAGTTAESRTVAVGDGRSATAATCELSADGAAKRFAAKNPKPKKRLYPLQRPGSFAPAPPPRNAPCVCGSGAKFKRCCGA